jgi:hypothetical protein
MNVNLHIERLVLDGLDIAADQRHVLQTAMEVELGRLLAGGGLASEIAEAGAIPRVAGSAIQLSQPQPPQDTGRQLAKSVYGAIGMTATANGPENRER